MSEDTYTRICVVIPDKIGKAAVDDCFMQIADLAYDLQPHERDWDVFVYGTSGIKEDDL